MANAYSNHFGVGGDQNATPATLPETTATRGHFAPRGVGGSPVKHRLGRIDAGAAGAGDYASTELFVFFQCHSSTRVLDMLMSTDGAFAATTWVMDVGVYEIDIATNVVGAAIEADIFAVDLNLSAAGDRVDAFTDGALSGFHRGLHLWELTNVGATSYAEDPNEQWVIAGEITLGGAVTAGGIVQLEMDYKDD